MPEWGITYFGILKAGATAIPIDPASSVDEIAKFAIAGEASAIVISPKLALENPDLEERLANVFATRGDADKSVRAPVWTFDEVFEMPSEIEEAKRLALLPE